ncbi:hypothetical protein E4U48_007903 [Claviceps purpurea]|nr:hypothetical protein E4U48_007903 [Claviceps purpurea]
MKRDFLRSAYSTVPAPSVQYESIEGVEETSHYGLGRYHPLHIDDRLHKRYRIVHKLGHGTFSTVWLAVDEKTTKYVAIKIGTADADRNEISILAQMAQRSGGNNIREQKTLLIPAVLDQFELSGPSGNHPCLVTLPARCSLREAKGAAEFGLFKIDVARSLAAQLIMAVSLVHDRGYAHGDLHLGNLFLQLPSSLDDLPVDQLYERYGQPVKRPIIRLDSNAVSGDPSVPSYAVPAVWLGVRGDKITLGEARLMLGDFGVAFRPGDKSRFESYTPLVLRPPEALFEPETPLTFASDIWSLGCVIFELLGHRTLLDGYFLASQDYITAQQVDLQGPMPPAWWKKWEERPKWYSEEGKPLSPACDVWSWERTFKEWVQDSRQEWKMGTLADDELLVLLKLLRSMLAWKPSERPDISNVLKSEWVRKWALPAYHQGLETLLPRAKLY